LHAGHEYGFISPAALSACTSGWKRWLLFVPECFPSRPPSLACTSVIGFRLCRSRIAWGTLRQVLCYWQVLPPHIQPPGYCRPCAPKIIWHHCQFFSCISPRNGVLVFRNSSRETITRRPVLSGGCKWSRGFAVIDLSLEQLEHAQGFLDPFRNEIARPICL